MAGVTVPGTYKRDGNDLNTLKKEFRKVLLGGMPKIVLCICLDIKASIMELKTNVKAVKKMSSPDKLFLAIDGVEFGRGN